MSGGPPKNAPAGLESLNASRIAGGTGIARYDMLAVESNHFNRFIRGVEGRGFTVRASEHIPATNPAYIRPGNRTFYYNPEHFTVLDMMHEIKHFQQLKAAGNLRTSGGLIFVYEAEAYQFERALGLRRGFSTQYMDYLERQIQWYQLMQRTGGRVPPRLRWDTNSASWLHD
jgi:hypothetical protein